MPKDSKSARTAGSLPRVVGARRRGMTLDEACAQLVADAQDERDPFMRDLLLATAAGAMAEEAFKESKRGLHPTQDAIAAFHEHLDACSQCRNHPFALCEEGVRRLENAALG